jgi:hypothetical protein
MNGTNWSSVAQAAGLILVVRGAIWLKPWRPLVRVMRRG